MHAVQSENRSTQTDEAALARFVEHAETLVRELFDSDSIVRESAADPESEERWVIVRADVRGSLDSIMAAKKEYTARWVASVPFPERYLVRLSLNII